MKQWYENTNKGQKLFMWGVSLLLVWVYGAGLLPLAILTYLELGRRG